jgi:hypothetical protein
MAFPTTQDGGPARWRWRPSPMVGPRCRYPLSLSPRRVPYGVPGIPMGSLDCAPVRLSLSDLAVPVAVSVAPWKRRGGFSLTTGAGWA